MKLLPRFVDHIIILNDAKPMIEQLAEMVASYTS